MSGINNISGSPITPTPTPTLHSPSQASEQPPLVISTVDEAKKHWGNTIKTTSQAVSALKHLEELREGQHIDKGTQLLLANELQDIYEILKVSEAVQAQTAHLPPRPPLLQSLTSVPTVLNQQYPNNANQPLAHVSQAPTGGNDPLAEAQSAIKLGASVEEAAKKYGISDIFDKITLSSTSSAMQKPQVDAGVLKRAVEAIEEGASVEQAAKEYAISDIFDMITLRSTFSAMQEPQVDAGVLKRAVEAIEEGASVEQAANKHNIRHHLDINSLRSTLYNIQNPRVSAGVLRRAETAIEEGAPVEEAAERNGISHYSDMYSLINTFSNRENPQVDAGVLTMAETAIWRGASVEEAAKKNNIRHHSDINSLRSTLYNIQNPRVSAKVLATAKTAIQGGVLVEEAAKKNNIRHHSDIHSLRSTLYDIQNPRVDAEVLRRAETAIQGGASVEEAAERNGISHYSDMYSLIDTLSNREKSRAIAKIFTPQAEFKSSPVTHVETDQSRIDTSSISNNSPSDRPLTLENLTLHSIKALKDLGNQEDEQKANVINLAREAMGSGDFTIKPVQGKPNVFGVEIGGGSLRFQVKLDNQGYTYDIIKLAFKKSMKEQVNVEFPKNPQNDIFSHLKVNVVDKIVEYSDPEHPNNERIPLALKSLRLTNTRASAIVHRSLNKLQKFKISSAEGYIALGITEKHFANLDSPRYLTQRAYIIKNYETLNSMGVFGDFMIDLALLPEKQRDTILKVGERFKEMNIPGASIIRLAERAESLEFMAHNHELLKRLEYKPNELVTLAESPKPQQQSVVARGETLKRLGLSFGQAMEVAKTSDSHQASFIEHLKKLKDIDFSFSDTLDITDPAAALELGFTLKNGAALQSLKFGAKHVRTLFRMPETHQRLVLEHGSELKKLGLTNIHLSGIKIEAMHIADRDDGPKILNMILNASPEDREFILNNASKMGMGALKRITPLTPGRWFGGEHI